MSRHYHTTMDVSQTICPIHYIGQVNTNSDFCLSSAHCGCVLNHVPFSYIGNMNAILNVSPTTVHCGCVPNHKPYLLQNTRYMNTIINVSPLTVKCGCVPNHLPHSLCRQLIHNHIRLTVISRLWLRPKPCTLFLI